jgi:hypothetical protein
VTGSEGLIASRHRWWRPHPGDRWAYPIMRLLWIPRVIGVVPRRAWPLWLVNALTYTYEICFECGTRVGRHTGSYWLADDSLWLEVMGSPDGVVCPRCFTERAEALGMLIEWRPRVANADRRRAKPCYRWGVASHHSGPGAPVDERPGWLTTGPADYYFLTCGNSLSDAAPRRRFKTREAARRAADSLNEAVVADGVNQP